MSDQQTPPICDYEGSDYQERFWERGGREYEDLVEGVALERLLPEAGERLLEIGAGAGRHTPRYDGFKQVVLFDYSRTQLKQAQGRLGTSERLLYVVGDAYRLPFCPGVFDCATMIRTLHHIANPPQVLNQVRTVLHQGAVFVLEYANKQNLKAIARWLLQRQEWNPFEREIIEFAPINFNFHPAEVRKWLEEVNLGVDRQLTVSHFRLNLLKRTIPTRFLVKMDSLAQRTGDWWQLSPSVFVRATAEGTDRPTSSDSIFLCPECGATALEQEQKGSRCSHCGRLWGSQDGLIDFKEPLENGNG